MKSALRALVLTLLVLSTYALPAQTGKFQSIPTYPVAGYSLGQMVLADFNHDGSPDIAVLGYDGTTSDQVLIMLNNGDGTFKPPVVYASGSAQSALAVGDFNGDGKLDLVVANSNPIGAAGNMNRNAPGTCTYGCVTVLLGNGDGTFQPGQGFTTASGSISVAVGDFNGDGKLDIATSNNQANTVSVLLGNGDGTFQPAVNYNVAAPPGPLAIGDFNGDHHPDIVVTTFSSTGGVQALLGKGDGTFQSPVNYSTGGIYDDSIVIADFNGDGKLDLAVGDDNNTFTGFDIRIMLGNGDGTFQTPQTLDVNFFPSMLAVGDANGDGKPDLIMTAYHSGITIALGRGDGSFQSLVSYSGFLVVGSLAVGDMNGDGKLDIAVANGSGLGGDNISEVLGFGDGTFAAPLLYHTPIIISSNSVVDFALGVVAADFNKDGFLDLGFGTGILLGNGDGSFTQGASYSAGSGAAGVAADFNNDGNLDLAWANDIPNGTVYVQLGNGDGTFQKAMNNPAHKDPGSIVAADFNRDGLLDLVTANWNSADISVLLGKGNGTFNFPNNYRVVANPEGIATGDFNGDGNPDLVVVSGSSVNVLLGNGDGTFKSSVTNAGLGGSSVAVADINGDGRLDIVVAGTSFNGDLSVLMGNGDGTFQPAINTPEGYSLRLLLADFNGDGKLDAVTIESNGDLNESAPIAVQLGNGDGTFQPPVFYNAGFFPVDVAAGDFNGDGAIDLVVSDNSSSSTILLNTGGTFLATTNAPNPSTLQQNVTFTTNVTAGVRGQPVPTGKVTFVDGTTTLGSATLSNGQAIFTTSFNTSGQHQITPTYSGDSNFNPHTGTAVTQTVQAPTVNISPTQLNFGNQKVGTKSAPMSAKLTNRGAGTLLISSITVSNSDFSVANNCGSSVGQNKSCTLTVTFTPSKTGTRTGTISVTDNATNSPQKVFVTGNGT